MAGWGILGIERGLGHVNREVVSLCYFEAVILTGVSYVDVAPESKNPLLSRHIEHQIPVVRYGHELGERWSAKDSMVGAFEVSDHEVDVVGAEVV